MNFSYEDTGPCVKCGMRATEGPGQGCDPCLGLLPGVAHACCGHGVNDPYVVIGGTPGQSSYEIENGVVLRGESAETFFALVRDAGERLKVAA